MAVWIVNASPLILLGKIGRLEVLEELAPSLAIPAAVASEVLAGPADDPARIWCRDGRATAFIVPDAPVPPAIQAWDLGAGETAVIAAALEALEEQDPICILDDRSARNCANVFRLPLLGTLGILVEAKAAGLVPRLRPEIDRLLDAGSLLSPEIVRKALALADEAV